MSKPRIPKRITVEWLRRRYACPEAVELFKTMFGRSAEFTRSNVTRFEDEFGCDVTEWLVDTLFGTDEGEDMYNAVAHRADLYRTYRRLFWREIEKRRGEQK